jgi:FKBP-type peptidyl-prolyl cis-trans isomerase (trigger factor)
MTGIQGDFHSSLPLPVSVLEREADRLLTEALWWMRMYQRTGDPRHLDTAEKMRRLASERITLALAMRKLPVPPAAAARLETSIASQVQAEIEAMLQEE